MELDLTEAIEAAAIAWRCYNRAELEHAHPDVRRAVSAHLFEHPTLIAAVRAAVPIIERAVRERLGGICGDQAPRLVLTDEGEESGAGLMCELTHGHKSEWHEAPNEFGPPMRWRNATVTISGVFDE